MPDDTDLNDIPPALYKLVKEDGTEVEDMLALPVPCVVCPHWKETCAKPLEVKCSFYDNYFSPTYNISYLNT